MNLEPSPGRSGCGDPAPRALLTIVIVVARLTLRALRHPRRAWWAARRELRHELELEQIPGGYRTR